MSSTAGEMEKSCFRYKRQRRLLRYIEILSRKVLTRDRERFFSYAAKAYACILRAPVCSLWLSNDNNPELLLKGVFGRPVAAESPDYCLHYDSFLGQAVTGKQALVSTDVINEPQFVYRDIAQQQGWKAALVTPILDCSNKVLGVIAAFKKEADEYFDTNDLKLAKEFCRHLAIALKQLALLRHSEKYELFFDTTQEATLLLYPDGEIADSNRAAARLLNYEKEALYQRNIIDLFTEPRRQQAIRRRLAQLDQADDSLLREFKFRYQGHDVRVILGDRPNTLVDSAEQIIAIHSQWPGVRKTRAKQLDLICEILSESMQVNRPGKLLRNIALHINETFAYQVDIGLIEQEELVIKGSVYGERQIRKSWSRKLGEGIMGTVAKSGELIVVDDVADHSDPRYIPLSSTTRSEMALPITSREGRIIGVLNLESSEPYAFLEQDRRTFETIANAIALAVEYMRRHNELLIFRSLADAAGGWTSFREVLHEILPQIIKIFDASAGMIHLSEPGDELNLFCHSGLGEAVSKRLQQLKCGQGVAGEVLAQAHTHAVSDLLKSPETMMMPEDGFISQLSAPIKSDSKVLGVVSLLTKDPQNFSNHEIRMLETISANIGMLIAKGRLLRHYRYLFQNVREPIVVSDLNKIIVDVNEDACETLGYSRDELIGQPQPALFEKVDNTAGAQVADRLERLAKGEKVRIRQFQLRHKDGSNIVIETRPIAIRNETGKVMLIQSTWRNITRQQALIDIIRLAHSEVDRHRLLQQFCERVKQILNARFGYIHSFKNENNSDINQLDCTVAIPSDNSDATAIRFQLDFLINEIAANKEERALVLLPESDHETHLQVPLQVLTVPLLGRQERMLGVMSMLCSVSCDPNSVEEDLAFLKSLGLHLASALERINLTESKKKQEVATRIVEQIGLVESFLGHRLGNSIGQLPLIVRELRRRLQPQDASIIELIDDLETDCRRAALTIEQFRGIEKLQPQERETVALGRTLRRAISLAEAPPQIHIQCDLLPEVILKASPYPLTEVFLGLIRNAVEAIPKGGLIHIEAYCIEDYVKLLISDNGRGIDDNIREKLFTPFFSTKRRRDEGMGIGLWLVRLYLQMLGGDIDCHSQPGSGTTFELRLPIAADDNAKSSMLLNSAKPDRTRALILDDLQSWRTLFSKLLTYRGFVCRTAETLKEAMQAADEQDYDVFLVDIRLVDYDPQNMQGIEFVEHILHNKPTAPVLIISGHTQQWQKAHDYFHNYNNVVVKRKTDMEGIEEFIGELYSHHPNIH